MINSYFLSVTNWTRLQNLGKSLNPELWEEPWGLRCKRIVRNLKQSGRQPRERRWLDKRIDNSSQYFANGWMCLPSLTAPHLNFSKPYVSSVEFQMVSDNANFCWFYTRVEPLFCPWYPLFSHFLVTVAIMVCLKSLILTRGWTYEHTFWLVILVSWKESHCHYRASLLQPRQREEEPWDKQPRISLDHWADTTVNTWSANSNRNIICNKCAKSSISYALTTLNNII